MMKLQSLSVPCRFTKTVVLTLYFIVSFYCFGALVIENDVNYKTWYFIRSSDFPLFHQQLQRLLLPVFMFPLALQLFLCIVLLWAKPSNVSKLYVWALVFLNIYILGISFLLQVPIHDKLNVQKSNALLNELIYTHASYRLPAEVLLFILNGVLLFKLLELKASDT